ncbi:helix-turn-helix transcriptional regulator [Haloarchaeobius sp. DT45]|uniref:helix-turn-helix transcriptional regulator n=1 Tax=Haloarchaeobius sp. DT45 TaxID=3446116 RepID=UPI003F6C2C08
MAGSSGTDIVEILSKRRRFLASLSDSPRQKPALAEDCDVARSTVDRAIRELEAAGLVTRGRRGYELSVSGELLYEQFCEFERRADAICGSEQILSMLPDSDLVDPQMLVGGTLTTADMHAPDRPMQETVDLVSDAVRVRGVSPAAHGAYVEIFDERIHGSGMVVELVFTPDVYMELATTYAEYMEREVPEYVTFYQIDELPPHGIMVVEHEDGSEEASFGAYTDSGLQAMVRNTREEAVRWAERRFEHFRDQATVFQL